MRCGRAARDTGGVGLASLSWLTDVSRKSWVVIRIEQILLFGCSKRAGRPRSQGRIAHLIYAGIAGGPPALDKGLFYQSLRLTWVYCFVPL